MPSYLDEIIGLSNTLGTLLIAITMVIMVPLAFTFGKLSDNIGNKPIFLVGLGGLTLLSALAFYLINLNGLAYIFIGILILGILLSIYEGTMPGTIPTLFHTDVRYRALSVIFNVSTSIFGGTTPMVSTWLVHQTGNNLAPAFYLTAISIVGFLVIAFMFSSTTGKSLKGSYPTVATESEYQEAVENPKDSLWWKKEKRKAEMSEENPDLDH